jgi:hypothetical protein
MATQQVVDMSLSDAVNSCSQLLYFLNSTKDYGLSLAKKGELLPYINKVLYR